MGGRGIETEGRKKKKRENEKERQRGRERGRGARAPASKSCVRLVAEGSAREKERHEPNRFLGLAGTFSRLQNVHLFSLLPQVILFGCIIFDPRVHSAFTFGYTSNGPSPSLPPPLDCNPRKIFCPFYRRYTHVRCRRYVSGRRESSVEGGRAYRIYLENLKNKNTHTHTHEKSWSYAE